MSKPSVHKQATQIAPTWPHAPYSRRGRGFSYVAGTLRVPFAKPMETSCRSRASVAARGACLLHGFTLVELLVVIAIIGVLVALLLPAVQAARAAARRSQCTNNLKQLGIALHNFHGVKNVLPSGFLVLPGSGYDEMGAESTWRAYILPYMEAQNIYDLADFTRGFGQPIPNHPNHDFTRTKVPGFSCPSSLQEVEPWAGFLGRENYVGNNGFGPMTEANSNDERRRKPELEGVFALNSKISFNKMTDGSSKTAMVSEILLVPGHDQRGVNYPEGVFYHHNRTPNSAAADEVRNGVCESTPEAPCIGVFTAFSNRQLIVTARSAHPSGVNILMGGGSVHFVSDAVAQNVWESACTPQAIVDDVGNPEILFPGF